MISARFIDANRSTSSVGRWKTKDQTVTDRTSWNWKALIRDQRV